MKDYAKTIIIFSLIFSFILSISPANAYRRTTRRRNQIKIWRLNLKIKRNSLAWTAANTNITPDDLSDLCGLMFEDQQSFAYRDEEAIYEAGLSINKPPKYKHWDLRAEGYITPVRSQYGGTCYAYSAIGGIESAYIKYCKINGISISSKNVNFSEQAIISCDESNYGICGGFIGTSVMYSLLNGVATEVSFPVDKNGYCIENTLQSFNVPCQLFDSAAKINFFLPLNGYSDKINNNLMASALERGFTVMAGMILPDDFAYYDKGIYWPIGHLQYGHAVLIVGYEKNPDCGYVWICKNSWDTAWGEKGYFKIPWDVCDTGKPAFIVSAKPVNT